MLTDAKVCQQSTNTPRGSLLWQAPALISLLPWCDALDGTADDSRHPMPLTAEQKRQRRTQQAAARALATLVPRLRARVPNHHYHHYWDPQPPGTWRHRDMHAPLDAHQQRAAAHAAGISARRAAHVNMAS